MQKFFDENIFRLLKPIHSYSHNKQIGLTDNPLAVIIPMGLRGNRTVSTYFEITISF